MKLITILSILAVILLTLLIGIPWWRILTRTDRYDYVINQLIVLSQRTEGKRHEEVKAAIEVLKKTN